MQGLFFRALASFPSLGRSINNGIRGVPSNGCLVAANLGTQRVGISVDCDRAISALGGRGLLLYPKRAWMYFLYQPHLIASSTTMNVKLKLYEGGCLCGAIRFRATGAPGKAHTCSCTSCRKHSGSLTLSWVEFPALNVEWTGPSGKPSTWRSSPYSNRAFCSTCGTTIGAIDDESIIALATGSFDKPNLKDFAPTYHSYVSRMPRWWHVHSDYEAASAD